MAALQVRWCNLAPISPDQPWRLSDVAPQRRSAASVTPIMTSENRLATKYSSGYREAVRLPCRPTLGVACAADMLDPDRSVVLEEHVDSDRLHAVWCLMTFHHKSITSAMVCHLAFGMCLGGLWADRARDSGLFRMVLPANCMAGSVILHSSSLSSRFYRCNT